jgi:hypothetical protein
MRAFILRVGDGEAILVEDRELIQRQRPVVWQGIWDEFLNWLEGQPGHSVNA